MISFMPTGIGHSPYISISEECLLLLFQRLQNRGKTHMAIVYPLTVSTGSGLEQIRKRKRRLRSQATATQHHPADRHPPSTSWLMNEWSEHMDTRDTSKAAWTRLIPNPSIYREHSWCPICSQALCLWRTFLVSHLFPDPLSTESIPGVPFVMKKIQTHQFSMTLFSLESVDRQTCRHQSRLACKVTHYLCTRYTRVHGGTRARIRATNSIRSLGE